jgi:hypothetical protein
VWLVKPGTVGLTDGKDGDCSGKEVATDSSPWLPVIVVL